MLCSASNQVLSVVKFLAMKEKMGKVNSVAVLLENVLNHKKQNVVSTRSQYILMCSLSVAGVS